MKFIIKRIGYALIVLIVISILAFLMVRLAPGSPARILLPQGATDEQIRLKEIEMGLDRPLYEQYFTYMKGLLRGDLGYSYSFNRPNLELISDRLPATLLLTLAGVFVSLLISIPLGVLGGIKRGSFIDFLAIFTALLGQSMSPVWVGVLLMLVFAVWLGWLPSTGIGTWKHIIMPAVTMGLPLAAVVTRITRAGMIDVLQEDYITATYAKGLSKGKIIFKYALKNVLIPVITIVGIQIGTFLGGAIVVEQIFSWPGIGMLCMQSILNQDFQLVQSLLLVISAMFVFINLIVDVVYSFVDPRTKLS